MDIDGNDADFAANASGICPYGRRHAAFAAAFRCDLAPDNPSRFKYTSASVEPQCVARVA